MTANEAVSASAEDDVMVAESQTELVALRPAAGRLTARWWAAVLHEARPRQWPKNLLVFAAPLAGATMGRPYGLAYAFLAAVAFGCASASVYFVNDVMDVERDRRHPVKCNRPIASGDLPPRDALCVAAILAVIAVGAGFAIGEPVLSAVTGGYLLCSSFYSLRGKHIPYLEMVLVASGFVLRVLAGAVATHVPPSLWFLAVCSLGALSVAVAKRYAELTSLGASAVRHRPVTRFYDARLIRVIQAVVAAAMVATYVMWATGEGAVTRDWHIASALPLAFALVRFGVLTGRRTVRPVEDMITRDGLMIACEASWLALFIVGLYQ
ncbi:MAG TPA: decaprenyl-phosphate phosphoribosyltransferase [Trebonia sp.]|nr:decaprenyl-phosphate phosphoribosyltransferase [Trebonia sp.]